MNTGRHKATILKNDIRAAGTGTEFVYLLLDIDGEKIAAQIWLSKKALNMAKGQLRACGFDIASMSLAVLKENHEHLADKRVDVDIEEEEYKGEIRVRARIVASEVTKKRIRQIDELLKGNDKDDPEEDIPF